MSDQFDEKIMREVVKAARSSLVSGESPFAAALTLDHKIVVIALNKTKESGNPLLHSEIVAINEFIAKYGSKAITNATLFCSCEPCVLCFSAIQLLGIKRVVFGASIQDAITYHSGDINVSIKDLAREWAVSAEIIPGILRNEVIQLFEEYTRKFHSL